VWTLVCNTGYSVPSAKGNLAVCDGFGELVEPIPGLCEAAARCNSADIQLAAGIDPTLTNNCPEELEEGAQCGVECPTNYLNIGSITCSQGEVLGYSSCIAQNGGLTKKTAIKVASTFQVTLSGSGTPDQWVQVLESSLEDSLGAQISSVILQNSAGTIIANTTGLPPLPTTRRLQSTYRVAYEAVTFPGDGGVTQTEVAARAYALAQAGSKENEAFKGYMNNPTAPGLPSLTAGAVSLLVAPRVFQSSVAVDANGVVAKPGDFPKVVPSPAPPPVSTTEEADVGAIIGGILGGLVGLFVCMGCCYCYYLMRKRLRES